MEHHNLICMLLIRLFISFRIRFPISINLTHLFFILWFYVEFKSVTSSVIGDKMASGEDFTFAWYNDSRGLCVEKGGVVKSVRNT